jgi:hypothetical protein
MDASRKVVITLGFSCGSIEPAWTVDDEGRYEAGAMSDGPKKDE